MPSRRAYLAGLITASTSSFVGCTALIESDPLHKVEMDNNTGEDIEAAVEVSDSENNVLFTHTFSMKAGNMDEGAEPFDGEPERISITVGEEESLTAPWPTRVTEVRVGERPEIIGEAVCTQGGQEPTGVLVRLSSPVHAVLGPTCGTFQ
ncbi:uncharacterized protein HfgLR_12995 [Haloferax gibbonsii]|uniref:Lipoprotein n=1 Tax=Haloferax gibbonsii TaxID=35746 RepID=A0A871BI58_HALGI|nr:hypothetical protein [Haloferax gibbonsii]QOS12728.1 uncharacterized protein HfgLR_12995 [Haloferax gibbonsii]